MRVLCLLLALLALAGPLRALELSLEENRTQKGSVGYVDMQRVFAESPDSATAKESFDTIVREAEERVNLKRAEILKLRQQLADVKAERDKLSKEALLPPPAAVSTASAAAVGAPPVPVIPPVTALPPAPRPAPASNSVRSASAPATLLSTAALAALLPPSAAAPAPTPVTALPPAALPGLPSSSGPLAPPVVAPSTTPTVAFSSSTHALGSAYVPTPSAPSAPVAPVAPVAPAAPAAPVAAPVAPVAPVAASPAAPSAATPPKAAPSASPTPASVAASTPTAAPAATAVPAATAAPAAAGGSVAVRVLDLDSKIISLQADILHKEEALSRERSETDRGLVSIEGRKTDQVLVKIYAAITAVAREEGLSIVIDRGTILYGQQGVDLTDKVLLYLRSAQQ